MSELKVYIRPIKTNMMGKTIVGQAYYLKSEVDAVIGEKDAEIRRLNRALWLAHAYKAKFKRWWLHLALDCESSNIRPDVSTIKRIERKMEACFRSESRCRAMAEKLEEA